MGGERLYQQLAGTPVDAIMRLVAERYIGATTSQSNPEAKRVKKQRGQTVAFDRQHTEMVHDQVNHLPLTPEFSQDFAAFKSTHTPGASTNKV